MCIACNTHNIKYLAIIKPDYVLTDISWFGRGHCLTNYKNAIAGWLAIHGRNPLKQRTKHYLKQQKLLAEWCTSSFALFLLLHFALLLKVSPSFRLFVIVGANTLQGVLCTDIHPVMTGQLESSKYHLFWVAFSLFPFFEPLIALIAFLLHLKVIHC